ncbi:MAG: LuxR family transcriptional regulator [Nevskia sp.]|nr:LuxR family transcriptional regulator [Nevskia sp.]
MSTRRKQADAAPASADPHKLSVPRTAGAVPRAAILQRVFGRHAARIVVLQAPAGHGKTTTLAQIENRCRAEGARTGWISLDEGDNDSHRFSAHLRRVSARLGGGEPGAGADEAAHYRSDWLIARLARGQQPAALFFDDFQSLTDAAILAFCRDFLVRAPANLRIFIGARTLPELGLARLVVGGHALLLRADELRFSQEEVAHFFRAAPGIALSADEVNAIFRRTEGWAAAVQLFRLSLERPSTHEALQPLDRFTPRELADYLADAVLSAQPEPRRSFLLETSLLRRLTAPLCEEVAGCAGAQATMVAMQRGGLFLRALDAELRWFRYHPLFSSFLADQLRQADPARVAQIHRRAARWLRRHGDLEEALHHAVACSDFEFAADVLDEWSSELVADGHMSTVERWLELLPPETVERRPELALKAAWAMVFPRRRKNLERYFALLQRHEAPAGPLATTAGQDILLSVTSLSVDDIPQALAHIERLQPSDAAGTAFGRFEQAALSNAQAYRAIITGAFDEAARHLVRAKAFNPRADTSFAGGYTACFEGIGLMLQGRLALAHACFERGLDSQRAVLDKTFVSAALASCAAWSLYEANALDAVDAIFEEFGEAMLECILPDFLPLGHIPVARAAFARGREDAGNQVLERAERIAIGRGWPRIARLFDWERTRLALLGGSLAHARKLAVRACAGHGPAMPQAWTPVSEDIESARFGEIRLAMAAGRLDAAARLLDAQRSADSRRLYRQLRLDVLQALLLERRGLRVPALRRMARALELAAPHGHIRVFLDEGPAALALVRALLQQEPEARRPDAALLHAQRVAGGGETVARSTGSAAGIAAAAESPELQALTEREKEIFRLLSLRLGNREIAERSYVSENTVKFHLKNIFAKLGIETRQQAYAVGHRLGLADRS